MKKLTALILALVLTLSFAACSEGTDENEKAISSASDVAETDKDIVSDSEAESEDEKEETATPDEEKEPSENEEASNPPVKPQEKPQDKPETEKPQENTPKTLGNTLLADFKLKASSGDTLTVAKALLKNSAIKFSGDAVNVEPGFLTGFGNNEISGFKDGAMFLPIIGTIPFVGFVFELDGTVSASDFISNLKSKADMRWNVCSQAEEMVAGSVGNRVFFVMCP